MVPWIMDGEMGNDIIAGSNMYCLATIMDIEMTLRMY